MATGHPKDFDARAFGPLGPIYETWMSSIEEFGRAFGGYTAQPFDPFAMSQRMTAPFKVAARCQLEVLGLMNRRTQAYLQMPTRLAQCRSPQDVFNEQMGFWRTATEQYTDTSRKVFATWASEAWSTSAVADPKRRDYINFNGTGSKESGAYTGRPDTPSGKQRRVA